MTEYSGTLTIDEPGVLIDEVPAIYLVSEQWTGFSYLSLPTLIWASCRLDKWMCGDRPQTRETAVALAGEDRIQMQEKIACEEWVRSIGQ